MDGLFLINKPKNWTSFDVCAKLRKKFNTKKVGHTGTLDPFAEGLMIVAMGKATKIIPYLENLEKEYVATLSLGKGTDTLDFTGKIIEEKIVPILSSESIDRALKSFMGKINQIPPMYSALKKDGVPLYALAREGINIERKSREVEVFDIKLLKFDGCEITFYCRVSKGTYIRSLAYDLAQKLNTTGHLISLTRTSIGRYTLDQAKDISSITEQDQISIIDALSDYELIEVDEETEKKVRNGIRLRFLGTDKVLLVSKERIPLAIYLLDKDGYYYIKRGLF